MEKVESTLVIEGSGELRFPEPTSRDTALERIRVIAVLEKLGAVDMQAVPDDMVEAMAQHLQGLNITDQVETIMATIHLTLLTVHRCITKGQHAGIEIELIDDAPPSEAPANG